MMILLGGGELGAIFIDSRGIHRLPPVDPGLIRQWQGLNRLLRVSVPEGDLRDQLNRLTQRVSEQVIAQAETLPGRAAGTNTVLFLDGDDGFVCGNGRVWPLPHWLPGSGGDGGAPRPIERAVGTFTTP